MAKRPYKQDKRAKQTGETRQRIVEAVVELHRTVGPANTSISAIADLAGVQRLTVYRHFEDDAAIFRACTSHYLALNPPPDPVAWQNIADAAERLCGGRLVIVHEGGYSETYVPFCGHAVIEEMSGTAIRVPDPLAETVAARQPGPQWQAHLSAHIAELAGFFEL